MYTSRGAARRVVAGLRSLGFSEIECYNPYLSSSYYISFEFGDSSYEIRVSDHRPGQFAKSNPDFYIYNNEWRKGFYNMLINLGINVNSAAGSALNIINEFRATLSQEYRDFLGI